MSIETFQPGSDIYDPRVYEQLRGILQEVSVRSPKFYEAYRRAFNNGSLASVFPDHGFPDQGYIRRTILSSEAFFNLAADPLALRHRISSDRKKVIQLHDGSVIIAKEVDKDSFTSGVTSIDPDYVIVAANYDEDIVNQWYTDPRYPMEIAETRFASLGGLMPQGLVLGEPQGTDHDIRFYS